MKETNWVDRIREMVAKVQTEVTKPGVNQKRGNWNPQGDCCAGSRIAHALGVPSGAYLDGIDEWAAQMGLTRVHVIAMLQDAGAGHDPIGPDQWPEPPAVVWRRLTAIREPPNLEGRDLSRLNLAGTDLRRLNLSRSDLQSSNLRNAQMEEINLSFARIQKAGMRGANLSRANLTGTDLSRADLTRANLTGARMRGARLALTKLAGATLSGTRLDQQRK